MEAPVVSPDVTALGAALGASPDMTAPVEAPEVPLPQAEPGRCRPQGPKRLETM